MSESKANEDNQLHNELNRLVAGSMTKTFIEEKTKEILIIG